MIQKLRTCETGISRPFLKHVNQSHNVNLERYGGSCYWCTHHLLHPENLIKTKFSLVKRPFLFH